MDHDKQLQQLTSSRVHLEPIERFCELHSNKQAIMMNIKMTMMMKSQTRGSLHKNIVQAKVVILFILISCHKTIDSTELFNHKTQIQLANSTSATIHLNHSLNRNQTSLTEHGGNEPLKPLDSSLVVDNIDRSPPTTTSNAKISTIDDYLIQFRNIFRLVFDHFDQIILLNHLESRSSPFRRLNKVDGRTRYAPLLYVNRNKRDINKEDVELVNQMNDSAQQLVRPVYSSSINETHMKIISKPPGNGGYRTTLSVNPPYEEQPISTIKPKISAVNNLRTGKARRRRVTSTDQSNEIRTNKRQQPLVTMPPGLSDQTTDGGETSSEENLPILANDDQPVTSLDGVTLDGTTMVPGHSSVMDQPAVYNNNEQHETLNTSPIDHNIAQTDSVGGISNQVVDSDLSTKRPANHKRAYERSNNNIINKRRLANLMSDRLHQATQLDSHQVPPPPPPEQSPTKAISDDNNGNEYQDDQFNLATSTPQVGDQHILDQASNSSNSRFRNSLELLNEQRRLSQLIRLSESILADKQAQRQQQKLINTHQPSLLANQQVGEDLVNFDEQQMRLQSNHANMIPYVPINDILLTNPNNQNLNPALVDPTDSFANLMVQTRDKNASILNKSSHYQPTNQMYILTAPMASNNLPNAQYLFSTNNKQPIISSTRNQLEENFYKGNTFTEKANQRPLKPITGFWPKLQQQNFTNGKQVTSTNRKLHASGSRHYANIVSANPYDTIASTNQVDPQTGYVSPQQNLPNGDMFGLVRTATSEQLVNHQHGHSYLPLAYSNLATGNRIVNGHPIITPNILTHNKHVKTLNNIPTVYLPISAQSSLATVPFNPLTNRFGSARPSQLPTKRHMTSGTVKRLTKMTGSVYDEPGSQPPAGSVTASATSDPIWSDTQNQEDDYQQSPQTIQITAVPNGLVGNGFGALNGWNNGWNGWGGPWNGRQVLLVNRQPTAASDWRSWALPIAVVLALPLVLGALFVPLFLKSVMFLIQILQMLGLLMPPHQLASHLTGQLSNSHGSSG